MYENNLNLKQDFIIYLKSERNCSEETIYAYGNDIRQFYNFLEQENKYFKIQEVTTREIRHYIYYMKEIKAFCNNSINRKINCLKSFFKFLYTQEYIDKNPMFAITAPSKVQPLPIYFSSEDVVKMLNAPNNFPSEFSIRDTAILTVLFYTGVRRNELINLNWKDINFGERTIKIVKAKGNKQRIIPMIDQVQEALWKYLNSLLPLNNDFVFLSEKGNRISETCLYHTFNKYLNLTGLNNKNYTIHKCRHTFATLLLKNEVDLITIQELLGHNSLDTTKVYLHLDNASKRKAIEKIIL